MINSNTGNMYMYTQLSGMNGSESLCRDGMKPKLATPMDVLAIILQ